MERHDSRTKQRRAGALQGRVVQRRQLRFRGGSNANWPSIQPISYAEPSGSKLFGLTQAAITNFNPATAVVWLHNDLNPANTTVGLQSGFHIVRARTFLPVSNYYTNQTIFTTTTPQNYVYANQAQVYNTFAANLLL